MFIAGKASKEDLFQMCGFEAIAKDGFVSKQDFIDLYTDISMFTETTASFVPMIEHCWQICSDQHCGIEAKAVQHLVAVIRQKLMSMSSRQSDEYVLRTVFNEFDVNKDGTLSVNELEQMLIKLQIRCDKTFLNELL